MDPRLTYLSHEHGFFTRQDAFDCGYDDRSVRAMLRAREWHRVRNGAYCSGATWAVLSPEARHLLLAKAVLRSMTGRVALSHTTAVVAARGAVWGADLSRVHITRLDGGAGRIEGDVHHHVGRCTEADIVESGGLVAVRPARALIEHASISSIESGLVSADSLLHRKLTDPDEAAATFAAMERWRGARRTRVALRLADGRAESVGESRSRFLFWTHGLPAPTLQYEIRDDSGRLVAVTDFAWLDLGLLGEFDGKVKYGRLLAPGQEPGDVVFAEKQREDLIRRITQMRMFRLTWSDLSSPRATAQHARSLMHFAA